MCGIRVDAEELIGNLLACKSLTESMPICMENILNYQKGLKEILPDFVFFETDLESILRASRVYKDYCIFDCDNQCLYLKDNDFHPDRQKVNLLYPQYLASAIYNYTEYFVEIKLKDKDMYYFEWKLAKIKAEENAAA